MDASELHARNGWADIRVESSVSRWNHREYLSISGSTSAGETIGKCIHKLVTESQRKKRFRFIANVRSKQKSMITEGANSFQATLFVRPFMVVKMRAFCTGSLKRGIECCNGRKIAKINCQNFVS